MSLPLEFLIELQAKLTKIDKRLEKKSDIKRIAALQSCNAAIFKIRTNSNLLPSRILGHLWSIY